MGQVRQLKARRTRNTSPPQAERVHKAMADLRSHLDYYIWIQFTAEQFHPLVFLSVRGAGGSTRYGRSVPGAFPTIPETLDRQGTRLTRVDWRERSNVCVCDLDSLSFAIAISQWPKIVFRNLLKAEMVFKLLSSWDINFNYCLTLCLNKIITSFSSLIHLPDNKHSTI